MADAPVNLSELLLHLNMTTASSSDQIELATHLEAAVGIVEGEVGPMVPRAVTERVYSPTGTLVLRTGNVLELSAVESVGNGIVAPIGAAVPVDLATIDADGGLLYGTVPGSYRVTYTAGYDPVPAALRLAVLIVAAHLWDTQRGRGARPRTVAIGQGGGDQQVSVPMGFLVPNRALELMAPYRRVVVA